MSKGFSVDVVNKKCVSPVCRGSYVNILEAGPLPNSDDTAWGMQCIFPKDDVVNKWREEVKKVYFQVLADKFGKDKAMKLFKALASKGSFPLRDGDDENDTATLRNADQLEGCYFLNSKNRFRQPHIIGAMGKPVDPETLTPDDIYSGAWYRCMLEFWYYDTAGNKGISTSLVAVMKVKDDTNLGSGTTVKEASSAFSGFVSEAADMMTVDEDEDEGVGGEEEEKSDDDDFDFLT